jgi:hypothetical protein
MVAAEQLLATFASVRPAWLASPRRAAARGGAGPRGGVRARCARGADGWGTSTIAAASEVLLTRSLGRRGRGG